MTRLRRLVTAERRLTDLASVSVEARLARYLLDLPQTDTGAVPSVRLPHAKKDIASLLAMSAETFSRQLGAWMSQEVIEVSGRNIRFLHRGHLESVANW